MNVVFLVSIIFLMVYRVVEREGNPLKQGVSIPFIILLIIVFCSILGHFFLARKYQWAALSFGTL